MRRVARKRTSLEPQRGQITPSRKATSHDEIQAIIGIGEVENCLLECLRIGHESKVLDSVALCQVYYYRYVVEEPKIFESKGVIGKILETKDLALQDQFRLQTAL